MLLNIFIIELWFIHALVFVLGMGFDSYTWCTKSKTRSHSSLRNVSYWKDIERIPVWGMEAQI